jgi:probable HAF family extracellular repeat protein
MILVGTGNSALTGAPHGFVWNGSFSDLGTIGGPTSSAARINDDGLVVGQAGTATFRTHAVAWKDGEVIDLHFGDPNGTTLATSVNNRGDIVGSYFSGSTSSAVVWRR